MPSLLVVDDDLAVIQAFRRFLHEMEVTVLSTQTGAGAIDLLCRYQPDVVIVNGTLPDQSGLEVVQQVHDRDATVPVILMTARSAASVAIEAIARGAFDYVCKPLQIEKVREVAIQAFKARRASLPFGRPAGFAGSVTAIHRVDDRRLSGDAGGIQGHRSRGVEEGQRIDFG